MRPETFVEVPRPAPSTRRLGRVASLAERIARAWLGTYDASALLRAHDLTLLDDG